MTQPIGYSYVRFSSKKQANGTSLHRQTQDTVAGESPESWCARNGVLFDPSTTYRDLGVSAYTGRNAKQGELRAFLEAVRTGRIRPGSYLLVERVDRITRQGVDEGMEVIKQILKAGVNIVTLANGRVYGPASVKKLRDGLLELQFYLEQAQEFSDALSARVGAAWEVKRQKARAVGTLATAMMPPWLEAVGEGDNRRAICIPSAVALVRRLFDMAIAGHGTTRIVRTMLKEGVPPLTTRRQNRSSESSSRSIASRSPESSSSSPSRSSSSRSVAAPTSGSRSVASRSWSRTSVRRILTDRQVLGEYQPKRGRSGNRSISGDPIPGYYPAIISLETFHLANAALSSRKNKNVGRQSRSLVNIFSGLLKDARNGLSYYPTLRVEKGNKRHYVMISATQEECVNSIRFDILERAILSCLREVDPRELIPTTDDGQFSVHALSAELAELEQRIRELEAELEQGDIPSLARALRKLEARKKEVADQLSQARLRAASPLSEAWGECKTLLGALDSSPDPEAARLRLRAVLRRVISVIYMIVVPRGTTRLCEVQVVFNGGDSWRHYLIVYRPPTANRASRTPARLYVDTTKQPEFAENVAPFNMEDLRNEDDVHGVLSYLEKLDKARIREMLEMGEEL